MARDLSRYAFGPWGLELGRGPFACALAATGVLQGSGWGITDPLDAGLLVARLREIQQVAQGSLPWVSYLFPRQHVTDFPARVMADTWRGFLASEHPELRLEVLAVEEPLDPVWVVEQLSHPDVGAASAFLSTVTLSRDRRWHWPLRVGFLGDAASKALARQVKESLEMHPWGSLLARFVELGAVGADCDLLLLAQDLRGALAAILGRPRSPRALCALVLGRSDEMASEAPQLLRTIQRQIVGNAVGVAAVRTPHRGDWFVDLIAELSHDRTLDVALAHASMPYAEGGLLLANGQWLESVRLSQLARTLSEALSHPQLQDEALYMEPEAAAPLGLAPGEGTMGQVGAKLRERIGGFQFLSESSDASALASLTLSAAAKLRSIPPERQDRQVQVRVYHVDATFGTERPERLARAFGANALHRVEVRIGTAEADWISSSEVFPDWELPPSFQGHRLTVVFSEPQLLPEPLTAHVHLPHLGSSTACSFYLPTREKGTRIEARIVVLYKNRVLQTCTLEATVFAHPSEAQETSQIVVRPEVVVSPGMFDLDRQLDYDAALILNHTTAGAARALKVVSNRAELIALDHLKASVDQIDDRLDQCDWGSKAYKGLTSPGTLDLLRFLAIHGSLLYRGVVKSQFIDQQMAAAQRLQVVAARPEARFPVEYFYELPSPLGDAKLCPGAEKALKAGKCDVHAVKGANANQFVCPLGFWGLSRVIERHLYRPEAARELTGHDFAIQQEQAALRKRLRVLESAVLGASEKADQGVKGSVARVQAALKKDTKEMVPVQTWSAWRKEVKRLSPSMLLLIPHTDKNAYEIMTMEIGGDTPLPADQINEAYVRGPNNSAPVVLLLGCETGSPDISFEGFVAQFRLFGAAIVVSTSAKILGRQATAVANQFITRIRAGSVKNDTTFGDVVLQVRREMLRKGYPMVLSVCSYGDADWRI